MAASRPPMYYVGRAIQEIRTRMVALDKTYTQEHVAHEADVSLRHFQKIEAGTIDLRVSTLFAIAKVLKRKPQSILDEAEALRARRR